MTLARSSKDRIVAAALELLRREGETGVSIRKVAEGVGLTPMAIYRHVADRDALLAAAAAQRFNELADEWHAKPRTGDAVELIVVALSELTDFALAEPHVFDYLFLASRSTARAYPADVAGAASPTFSILTELVERAMAERQLRRDDASAVAWALAALVHGLVALRHGGRIATSESDFRALVAQSVRRMINGLHN